MLDHELQRQRRLKAALAAAPATSGGVGEKHLIQNYKQLQFFDTLALYFNLRHDSERGQEIYVHVPMTAEADATITLRPAGNGTYTCDPFPFAGNGLEVFNHGRYLKPFLKGVAPDDLGAALRALPPAMQVYTFVPAGAA